MTWSALTFVHITGGGISIAAGFVALFAPKGEGLHRAAGNVFFVSMLMMTAAAAYLAVDMMERLVGILNFYLVATAWATVMRGERQTGTFEIGAFVVAAAVAAVGFFHATAVQAGLKAKYPAEMYFFVASLATLAATLDLTAIARRGVAGAQRIARHLWRMSVAMFFATGSYFLGQPKFVPAILKENQLHFVPVIFVLVLFLYWLIRVLFTRWYRSAPTSTAVHAAAE